MGLFDFLAMMVGAVTLTFICMMIGEKIISKIIRESGSPFIQVVGSFVFGGVILSALMFGVGEISFGYACLVSGVIILFNKYWFGHFSLKK